MPSMRSGGGGYNFWKRSKPEHNRTDRFRSNSKTWKRNLTKTTLSRFNRTARIFSPTIRLRGTTWLNALRRRQTIDATTMATVIQRVRCNVVFNTRSVETLSRKTEKRTQFNAHVRMRLGINRTSKGVYFVVF